MKTYKKYISEAVPSLLKIRACVVDIIRVHKGDKKKPIPYRTVCNICQERGIYKDDLPEVQGELEDRGFEIDYDKY